MLFRSILQMDDMPGVLASMLKKVAQFNVNILTIHQTIPINGVASLTMRVGILPESGEVSLMLNEMEQLLGVHYIKVLARE